MDKTGELELTVNWVYVIIAGGFLLLFFSMLGTNLGIIEFGESSSKRALRIAEIIEYASLYGYNAERIDEYHAGNIRIIIPDNGPSYLEYNNARSFLKAQVFSPEGISGRISYWIIPFSVYRPSSRIILLSGDNYYYDYYVDTNSRIRESLLAMIPSDSEEILGLRVIDGNPSSTSRNTINTCIDLSTDNNCHISVVSDEDNPEFGKIVFHNGGADKEYAYYNNAMIFAASYSHLPKRYENAMRSPMMRHDTAMRIYDDLASSINTGQTACLFRYNLMANNIRIIRNISIHDSNFNIVSLSAIASAMYDNDYYNHELRS